MGSQRGDHRSRDRVSRCSRGKDRLRPIVPILTTLRRATGVSQGSRYFQEVVARGRGLAFRSFLRDAVQAFHYLVLEGEEVPRVFYRLFGRATIGSSIGLGFFRSLLRFFRGSLVCRIVRMWRLYWNVETRASFVFFRLRSNVAGPFSCRYAIAFRAIQGSFPKAPRRLFQFYLRRAYK